MAALGEIAITVQNLHPGEYLTTSLVWRPGHILATTYDDESDSITGTVTEASQAVAGANVLLIDVATRQVISQTKANADGEYTFTNLNPDAKYIVLAISPNTSYNAQVYRV